MRLFLLPLLMGLAVAPAFGAEPDGRSLSQACTSCHGLEGNSPGAIPALAGRPTDELSSLMLSFRDKPSDATIMNRLMKGYGDEEIAALAAYFNSVSPSR